MQVYILSLCFFWFCIWTNRNRAPYILQVLNFAIVFPEKFLPVLHFANFLRVVTKYLKTVEMKIFNLSFLTKKSYRNIKNMKISAAFYMSI